ncbi:MAG: hypothetical protein ACRD3R_14910, partial [Terriglobales bacterium]
MKVSTKQSAFQIGFWHPFGPHSNENQKRILKRKSREVQVNGWTLWSFQHRNMLEDWHRQLNSSAHERVFVFCSAGGGKDPASSRGAANVVDCRSFRFVNESRWRRIPDRIRVPHTFPSGQGIASAFVVEYVVHPANFFELTSVEWLHRLGSWRKG